MTNQELYEELKAVREDIGDLTKEFYLFKGKAFGFIIVLSGLINAGISLLNSKGK